MYVPCWYWGDLLSLTTTGDSQLRHDGCFLGGPAVVLEPKGQQWWPFGTGRIRTIYMGTLWCCSLAPIRTPHAWPTSLITRKGVALNRSVTFAGMHLSNYGELKAHSELQIYDAACYDLYQKNLFTCTLTRCNLCAALRFIRSGVASMESHSSMEIKSKHEDDYGARSLPSRSFVSWDVDRCRNSAFHAMTFKKKKRFSISRLRFLSEIICNEEEVDHEQWLLSHFARFVRTYAEVKSNYRLYPHP